jgi:hypothetical protein
MSGIGSGLTMGARSTLFWVIGDDDGYAVILHFSNALYRFLFAYCAHNKFLTKLKMYRWLFVG